MNATRPTAGPIQTPQDAAPGHSTAFRSPFAGTLAVRLEVVRAFHLLLSAFNYASDAQLDRWQMAVELAELQRRGVALSDVRWLLAKGFADHRREITVPGDRERSFRPLETTDFPPTTAVTLTECGARAFAAMLPAERLRGARKPIDQKDNSIVLASPDGESVSAISTRPVWDQQRRELRHDNQIVKRYRVPAPNQELILQAFQEEGWPHCIDDPLPPNKACDVKGRLLATIKSLNRNQIAALILFHGNGRGFQVYWEPVSKPERR